MVLVVLVVVVVVLNAVVVDSRICTALDLTCIRVDMNHRCSSFSLPNCEVIVSVPTERSL